MDIFLEKNEPWCLCHTIIKNINLIWITDLNVKSEKQENIFMTLGSVNIKEKIEKLDFVKIENFPSKDTIKNVKKQATD